MKLSPRRWNAIQTQILVWCGDDPLVVSYDGSDIWVPPINKIAEPGLGSPYRLAAATTKAGVPLPGTVRISDIFERNQEGGRVQTFSVNDFCQTMERDSPEFFRMGFNIVTDPDDVKAVQDEGRPLYEQSLDARAQTILDMELARRKADQDAGRPVTQAPNEKEIVWAYRHKQGRKSAKPTLSTDQIFAAVSGNFTEAAPALEPAAVEITTPHGLSTQALVTEAEELGMPLNKRDLLALIAGDIEQIGYLREKIALKKKELGLGESGAGTASPA